MNPTPVDAVIALLGSRKFLVMLFTQLALASSSVVFKVITPDLAAEIGAVVASVWMAAHAHEEKGKT